MTVRLPWWRSSLSQALLCGLFLLLSEMVLVSGRAQVLSERNVYFQELLDQLEQPLPVGYCTRQWPTISLFVPVNIKPYKDDLHTRTSDEWSDIFLSSYLQFWPITTSGTRVVFMIDDECVQLQNGTVYSRFRSTIDKYMVPAKAPYKIATNNFDPTFWHKNGRMRQQLTGFFADKHVDADAEFVGFLDGDTSFITYVDREDLFENGKPIVRPRFGAGWGNWYLSSAEWLLGGNVTAPAKCMSYFPVLLRVAHLRAMRAYIEALHGRKMEEVFASWVAKFGNLQLAHFDPMCVYIYNFHRSEYAWHGFDALLADSEYFSSTQQLLESNFTASMMLPRPHISNHLVYHQELGCLEERFFAGVCHGPPFPKPDAKLEAWCTQRLAQIDRSGKRYPIDREFVRFMHSFE